MNRPCFSLGILLSSLAVCLFAVGSANSQTSADLSPAPCLMCPYAGHSFAGLAPTLATDVADLGDATSSDAVNPELTEEASIVVESSETPVNSDVADVDYELDYDTNYEADYTADYDYSDYDTDYEADYEAEADYDYSDYEGEYADSSEVEDTVPAIDADIANIEDPAIVEAESDMPDFDYSDADYYDEADYYAESEYDVANDAYEGTFEENGDSAPSLDETSIDLNDATDDDYDFDNYDYEDYFAEVYGDQEEVTEADDVTVETPQADTLDRSDDANVVSNPDVEAFDYFDAEVFAPIALEEAPVSDEAGLVQDDENYDFEVDYDLIEMIDEARAEVEAIEVEAVEVEAVEVEAVEVEAVEVEAVEVEAVEVEAVEVEAVEVEAVEVEAVEVEAVEVEAVEVEAVEVEAVEVEAVEVEAVEVEAVEVEAVEVEAVEVEAVEVEAVEVEAVEVEAVEVEAVEVEADVESLPETEASDTSLYNLRTTYDESYDEVMAPTVAPPVPPAPESHPFGWMDHCFGGYAEAYPSDYRCDLADQYHDQAYRSFYHDGPDPSVVDAGQASESEVVVEEKTVAGPALPMSVEPYVAVLMDRVGASWMQFSLDAIVAKTVSEVAKLPAKLAPKVEEKLVSDSISDYIDCYTDAEDFALNWCETDGHDGWKPRQLVGSPVKKSDSAISPARQEELGTAAEEAAKATFRDLNNRLNAARQSPPLR